MRQNNSRSLSSKFTIIKSQAQKDETSILNFDGLKITDDEKLDQKDTSYHETVKQYKKQTQQQIYKKQNKLVYEYLRKTKMEGIILLALRQAINGNQIPKNPYCAISRSLIQSNLKNDLVQNFENIAKHFRKNAVSKQGIYGISSVQFQKTQIFGLKHILELIDLPRFELYLEAIKEILLNYKFTNENFEIEITNSISGGIMFKSELFPYASSHPKDLEIFCEVFVTAQNKDVALDAFTKFVKKYYKYLYIQIKQVSEDVITISKEKTMNIIKEFIFYKSDSHSQKKNIKKGWNVKDIILKQNEFIADLNIYTSTKQSLYWKGYMKVMRFEDNEGILDTELIDEFENNDDSNNNEEQKTITQKLRKKIFQYIEVYKVYNFHYINPSKEDQTESFSSQKLGSLLKGIFLNQKSAEQYARFFYKPNEQFIQSKNLRQFIDFQLKLVFKKWQDQNIMACTWELMYMVLIIQEDDLRRSLMDSIIQILSSDLSALLALSKSNIILQQLIDLYENTSQAIIKGVIISSYKVYKQKLNGVYAKSSNSDILRNRELLYILFKEMEDKQGEFDINPKSNLVLRTIRKITKYTGLGNLQQIGSLTKNVPEYIMVTLEKRKLLNKDDVDYITYDKFLQKKAVYRVLNVEQEVGQIKKTQEFKKMPIQDIEDKLILTYFDKYDVYDTLYLILREIFFGQQLPNPIPNIVLRIEAKALKYQIFEVKQKDIAQTLLQNLEDDDKIDRKLLKNSTPDIFKYYNEDMKRFGLKPVYGLKDSLSYAAIQQLCERKLYLEKYLAWQNSFKKKPPENYQIADILSVTGSNLFQHQQITKRDYVEWNFAWEFLIKGENQIIAQNIYYDLLISYVYWLNTKDAIVIGFFLEG
ncbi:hypothetical protein IMG5_122430, partial [Ichthyophthirius multifiliis]